MAQRRYGPIRGAGVSITELEGEKTIEAGALGWAGYGGILEKGPVGELIIASKKSNFLKICGSYIEDSLLPDACIDYYDNAAGAGGLILRRVTDGNELSAYAMLYARYGSQLVPMGKIESHNGGRWGGKQDLYTNDLAVIGDLTEITLDTGITTFTTDQWKGGWIELSAVPNKRYPITGNTNTGIITVASDQTMLTDHGGGSDLRYYLILENEGKSVKYLIGDGEDKSDTEFSLSVYVDDVFIKKYPNLNTDPTSSRYWVNIINNDDSNYEIKVTDLWTGAHTAAVRPANHYGLIDIVTETVLTAIIHTFAVTNSPGGANPTFALGTTDNNMVAQKITVTMTGVGTFDASSDKFGDLGTGATDALFTPNNKWTPPFTIAEGATVLASGDIMVINYFPFVTDSLIGGYLYPDKANAKLTKFRIVDNDHDTITVSDGSDLTGEGAPADEFLVEAPLALSSGRDGHSELVDADYNQQLWDVSTSVFNRIVGRNMGLIKYSTPGVTSTAVQKAGLAYVDAKNHQYRYEIPDSITTENGAITYVNDTLGRSDFAVCAFPSYGWVADPEATEPGKLKLVTLTGQIHGREAAITRDYNGYHKAQAGISVTLPKILRIPTGEAILDEEQLNPVGITIIKKVKGNFIIWGDRTLHLDPNWKWKHQRELMSYYEHVLQESFDWIIFAINDPITQKLALAALNSFFIPEFQKRALGGNTFQEACIIKIDDENNTRATMATGDMNAKISLWLIDTVERFNITIGKQGIFDSVG